MEDYLVLIFSATVATYIGGKIYIVLWGRIIDMVTTPTGFGILLPLILIALAAADVGVWRVPMASFWIIAFAGVIYWFDDLKGLPPWGRISIAFLFGALLFWTGAPENVFTELEMLGLFITFGVISIAITNVINFYDGVDLNVALMIFLTGIILVFFSDTASLILQNTGWVMVGFSFGFGALNRIPLKLYLGDAGCFVFALLFLYFLVNYALESIKVPFELMSVLALPAFDVFFVLLIRLYYKHDMLSRNYLHLYQRIHIRFGGFVHLIPQLVNVGAILLLTGWIESAAVERFWALLFASVAFTPIFYLSCRFLFVERGYVFGDGE